MAVDVAEMRAAFDESFARPIEASRKQGDPALVISVGAGHWLLRLSDIAGVARVRPPLSVPGGSPALLGLTGVRGSLVPVYSLAALLGLSETPKVDALWVALASHGGMVGLAFDSLIRHAQLDREAVHFASDGSSVCRLDGAQLPIVDVAVVAATIRKERRE